MKLRMGPKQWAALVSLAILLGLSSGATPAAAQSCTASISAISYGSSVDVLPGTAIDTTGTWSITCTGTAGRTVRVCANIGRRNPQPAGGDANRRMQGNSTGQFLNHELYSDSGRTSRWGSWDNPGYGTGGVQIDVPLNSAGSGNVTRTIYARILASQQTARPDTYVMTFINNTHTYSFQYVSTTNSASPVCPYQPWIQYAANTTITATIPGLCYMTVADVNFGSSATGYSSPITTNGAIKPQCSNTLSYTVSLGQGGGGGTDPTQRKLANGTKQVTYGLYRDSAFTLPWGSTSGVNTAAGTGSGTEQSITVYGRLPVQSVPASGTYSDSVVVTLTY